MARYDVPGLALGGYDMEAIAHIAAQGNFLRFVRVMYPKYQVGWHHRALASKLEAVECGDITRLIVTMPPRHGKSAQCSVYFPAWYLGKHPDHSIIAASYAGGLSYTFSVQIRQIMEKLVYTEIFGTGLHPRVRGRANVVMANGYGGVISAGVGSGITGRGAHVLIIDDPIKDDEEAQSQRVRDKIWNWYTTTAYTRLMPGGKVVVIGTRWHEDDLIGRLLKQNNPNREDPWDVLHFPAIDDKNGTIPDEEGTALWPEWYSLAKLLQIKNDVTPRVFEALYQGRPSAPEGSLFVRAGLSKFVDDTPRMANRVRYWDKASTEGGGNYTVGALLSRTNDGRVYVEDVVRGQWSTRQRQQTMLATAELDAAKYGNEVDIWIEQEPGSGGKESAEITVAQLGRFPVHSQIASGPKIVRARPFAAQVEANNVYLVRGDWNYDFVEELLRFPYGENDDQVDAASGAYNKLATAPSFGFAEISGNDRKANPWKTKGW